MTDSSGASDTLDVEVKVLNTNRAPSIEAPQLRNAEIGQLLEIPIAVSDPDGDPVTLTVADLPAGATLGSGQRHSLVGRQFPSGHLHRTRQR